jgi:hypothetical protein
MLEYALLSAINTVKTFLAPILDWIALTLNYFRGYLPHVPVDRSFVGILSNFWVIAVLAALILTFVWRVRR